MNERTPKQTELEQCVCCGQPVTGDGELCAACEAELDLTPIDRPEVIDQERAESVAAPLVNLAELPTAFTLANGFWYPDWELIREVIERQVAEPERGWAWRDAMAQWLERLSQDLGANYVVRESGRFMLLSSLTQRRANLLFTFSEQALNAIEEELGSASLSIGAGQCPILLINDEETFDCYLRRFYPADTERMLARRNGVCLYGGCVHIALPLRILRELKRMVAHELTHATTYHLPTPIWLCEGLAMSIERTITGEPPIMIGHELASALRTFWTEKNIQTFWSGESFDIPGDSQELSYALAEIVFRYLRNPGADIVDFLKAANYKDGGQAATLSVLDVDLNDALAESLGPGEWRPNSEAIAKYYKRAGWE